MIASTNAISTLIIGSTLFASFGYSGQVLNAVWSFDTFSTISGPSGNEHGYSGGFVLLKEDGGQVFHDANPGGGTPCANVGDGTIFSLTGGCLADGGEFRFKCRSGFDGQPEDCSVLDKNAHEINSGIGESNTNFIGIAISTEGWCGTSFELKEGVDCQPGVTGFKVTRLLN